MSGLFVELYLDEDVDVLVAELLAAYGFRAMTARDAGLLGKTDVEQLEHAAAHDMAFLTHNRVHFERLALDYFNQGKPHGGIIFAVRRRPHEIVGRLLQILDSVSADEMRDQLRYI